VEKARAPTLHRGLQQQTCPLLVHPHELLATLVTKRYDARAVHNERRPRGGPLHHGRVQQVAQDGLHACYLHGATDQGTHV
jgi:hypothetical protein